MRGAQFVGARLSDVARVTQQFTPLDPVGGWASATVTANASAHTKGAWTELIASTAFDVDALDIDVGNVSASGVNTATLLDIGVGAAASETVIIPDVAVGGALFGDTIANRVGISFRVPIRIPKGSRVSARIQSIVTGGKTATVNVRPLHSAIPVPVGSTVDVIGSNTATSEAAATSGTVDTWTEIGTTTKAYDALVFVPSMASGAVTQGERLFFVGIGASGSEVALHSRTGVVAGVTENFKLSDGCAGSLVQRYVPAGTRLAVKLQGLTNTGFQACVLGIPRLP